MQRDKILNYFGILKKHGFIGSSYLFIGDDFSIVRDIIKIINCKFNTLFCDECWNCKNITANTHPDMFFVEPTPNTIKIEQIREAQRFLSLKSFCLSRKALILKGADNLTEEAANTFLKTLEEPPKGSFISICANKTDELLPTIISRCRRIFLPYDKHDIDLSFMQDTTDFLNGGRIKFADRNKFSIFLFFLISILRDHLFSEMGISANRLINEKNCEIILSPFDAETTKNTLEKALKIYSVYDTINENLALGLLRNKLGM